METRSRATCRGHCGGFGRRRDRSPEWRTGFRVGEDGAARDGGVLASSRSCAARRDVCRSLADEDQERRRTHLTPPAAWTRRIVPDDVLLFRYSALTFNSHRIHYDRRYVTEVEGYPGLVVHGPLLATLLVDLLLRHRPDALLRRFEFRASKPLFDVAPFDVYGRPEDDGRVSLWAQGPDATVAMSAVATLG